MQLPKDEAEKAQSGAPPSTCEGDRADFVLPETGYDRAKRALDVVFSLAAILVLAPVMLLIALAIWLERPHGNPIYVSRRCGKGGKLFRFYKFRTMCVGADEKIEALYPRNEADGPAFKMKDDPRITRLGKWMRKYSVDELPQLWNVLKGDMSVVGPRPPIPREVRMYAPRQMRRLSIKPGMTCYWQIHRHRNSLSFDEWVRLDLKYIKERSLAVDARIVLKTIRVMLDGEGI